MTREALAESAREAMTSRELLDPAELSAELKVPTSTLAQWRSRGEGPRYLRVGKHARYRRADIDRWLSERYAS